jgi:STE24 endopeptidase
VNEDKSTRYRRLHRRSSVTAASLAALVLTLLVVSGGSAALRDALATPFHPVTLAGYVLVLALGLELVQLPIAFYKGVTLERRYGLSAQPVRLWLIDHLKAGAVVLVLALAAALLISALIRWRPEGWWIAAAACAAAGLVALALAMPVVLLPLFYDVVPLDRPALAARLEAMAARAGAQILGVFEWRLRDRTRKANAALLGIGRTRRILVSDTLLAEHTDAEIEVVLAHELAHHVHRDIWSSLVVESLLLAAGLFAADRALTWSAGSFGLTGKADIAALPVVVLAAGAVTLALRPAANALSRVHERRADRFALDMTRDVPSFINAMKRLGTQNLAEEEPSRLVEVLFYTHPPMSARIAAARAWGPPSGGPASKLPEDRRS